MAQGLSVTFSDPRSALPVLVLAAQEMEDGGRGVWGMAVESLTQNQAGTPSSQLWQSHAHPLQHSLLVSVQLTGGSLLALALPCVCLARSLLHGACHCSVLVGCHGSKSLQGINRLRLLLRARALAPPLRPSWQLGLRGMCGQSSVHVTPHPKHVQQSSQHPPCPYSSASSTQAAACVCDAPFALTFFSTRS